MATVKLAHRTGSRIRSPQPERILSKSACVFLVLLLTAFQSAGQEPRPSESQVEAAYLYNFGKFVTFPPNRSANSDSFQICVLGKDPFEGILAATVRGESINGKKISLQRISSVQQGQDCSILFVSSSEEGRLPAILSTAQRLSLLTVSDMKNFAERGGVIELVRQQDRIRFEVNLTAAQESHLALSSELLKVAIRVLQKNSNR